MAAPTTSAPRDHAASPILVLVVGGEHRFVQGTLSSNLARHGMLVLGHWDWKMRQPPNTLPSNAEVVYIATDMVGHNLSNAANALAQKAGIPVVNGTRKWSESSGRLLRAGYPEVVQTPLPRAGGPFPTKERRKFYATCIAETPSISNADLEILIHSYVAEHNYTSGDSLDPALASQLRREFGVTFGRGPNGTAKVDLTVYVAACMTYGITPSSRVFAEHGTSVGYPSASITAATAPSIATVPTSAVPPEVLAAAPARNPTIPAPVAATPSPKDLLAAAFAKMDPPRTVEAAPVAPAPVPVAAPSSVIGNGTPSWMNDDLRVALQLVRAQFESLGIESITLTKTSTKFRRVVIEEGDVQI